MGADMLHAALVIKHGRLPDFEAGRAAIERLSVTEIENPDEFTDLPDPETEAGLIALRTELRRCLDELEKAFDHGREFSWEEVRGATVYITGGLSWGDSPTEAFELIGRLRAVRGVLSALGCENESPPRNPAPV